MTVLRHALAALALGLVASLALGWPLTDPWHLVGAYLLGVILLLIALGIAGWLQGHRAQDGDE